MQTDGGRGSGEGTQRSGQGRSSARRSDPTNRPHALLLIVTKMHKSLSSGETKKQEASAGMELYEIGFTHLEFTESQMQGSD